MEALLVAVTLAGWTVLVVHLRLRAAGRDPLGPRPDGEPPRTGAALLLGGFLWVFGLGVAISLFGGTETARAGGQAFAVFLAQALHLTVALAILPFVTRAGFRPRAGAGRLMAAGALAALATISIAVPVTTVLETAWRAAGRELPVQTVVEAVARARGADVVAYAVGTLVLAPFAEEVFYRGALLPFLVRGMGPRAGLLAQALVFGAIHFAQQPESLPLALPLAVVGWMTGWLYLRTGSLAAPIVLHAVFNAVNFAALRLVPPGGG